MTWPVATYTGSSMVSGTPYLARVALHSLMRGVNERERALGITKTQFYKADGTLGSDLAIEDLADIFTAEPNSIAVKNLLKVQSGIVLLLTPTLFTDSFFTVASGVSDELTVADVEASIGTSLSGTPRYGLISDGAFWQAMQDALDLMIYCRKRTGFFTGDPLDPRQPIITTQNRDPLLGDTAFPFATGQDAWDDMVVWTVRDTGWSSFYRYPKWILTNGGAFWTARSSSKTSNLNYTNSMFGELTAIEYGLGVPKQNYTGGEFILKVGEADPIDVSGSSTYFTIASTGGEIPLNGTGTISVELLTSTPATPPFSYVDSIPALCSIQLTILETFLYFDIESVLTNPPAP